MLKKLHKYFKSITVAGLPIGSALKGDKMFKKLIYDLLYKALEFVLVGFLGFWMFIFIEKTFATLWAIIGLSLIFYFFSPIIKPYIDEFRKWIYSKITKKNEKDN